MNIKVARRRKMNIPLSKIFLGLTFLTTIAGALFSTKTLANINRNIAATKEAARPANVKIVKITTSNCFDCFNVDAAVADFKRQNVKVEEEKTLSLDSPEASASIKQLAIKRVPTYIVSGEVTKNNLDGFVKNNGEVKSNTFIFTKVTPIFIDTDTKQEIGKVIATILTDLSCAQCIDPKLTIEGFKKAGVKITETQEVAWNSSEGQQIINQYKITKVPTFILPSDIDFYDNVKSNWAKFGTIEQDETYNSSGVRISSSAYVARNLILPYRDLDKGQVLGLIDLIYLTDSNCSDCYKTDVVQKSILKQGYGVGIRSERAVDISSGEGQGLVSKYKVTKVPTILLSPEIEQYANLKNDWKNVGTVEQDGWYVFRQMQALRGIIYKDLATNQIVGRVQQSATPSATKQ